MVVAPGFIDMLGQSELTILVDPAPALEDLPGHHHRDHRRRRSGAPLNDAIARRPTASPTSTYGITPDWRTFARIFRAPRETGHGDQPGQLCGRHRRCGAWCWATPTARPPPAELEHMQSAGARRHARRRGRRFHVAAICARALCQNRGADRAGRARPRKFGGIYATHMRNEGDADHAGARRSLPHRPRGAYSGRDLAPESRGQSQLGQDAARSWRASTAARRRRGHGANTYAYTAWFNSFSAFIPPWAHDGGDAETD